MMSQLNHNVIIEMNVFKCVTLNFPITYFWIKLEFGGFLKDVLGRINILLALDLPAGLAYEKDRRVR